MSVGNCQIKKILSGRTQEESSGRAVRKNVLGKKHLSLKEEKAQIKKQWC